MSILGGFCENFAVIALMAPANAPHVSDEQLRRILKRRGVDSADLDDAIQELRIRIWRKGSLINAAQEPKAYVTVMVWDVARTFAQTASLPTEDLSGLGDDGPCSSYPNPEEYAIARQDNELVERLVAEIDERFRDTYLARHFRDESVAEIAAAHGAPLKTVEKRLALGQRDVEAAWARVRAKERRGTNGRRHGLGVLFALFDVVHAVIARARRGLRRIERLAMPAAIGLFPGSFLLSDITVGHDPSAAVRSRLTLSDTADAAPRAAPQLPSAGLPEPLYTAPRAAAPITRAAKLPYRVGPLRKADPQQLGRPSAQIPSRTGESVQVEEELINGAISSLQDGTAEGRARARSLLEEHRDRFPGGQFAALRETFLQDPR